jgi:hypothetical protein
VAEIDGLAPSCTDTVRDADLGEVLASASWQPPLAGMRGLVSLPNGILAGFEDNQLCLSEPWRPHAWPPEYRMLTDWRIAGLGVFGTTLLVLTEGCTYLVSGSHPAAMSMSRLPGHQPCLSRRGLVSTEYGVAYPAPDGLYLVGPGGGRLLTGGLLGRGDWQGLAPETVHGACHDGRYFGFFEPPGPAREVPEEWLGGVLNGPALAGSPIAGRAGTGDPPAGPEGGSGFVLALAAGPSSDGPGLGWLDFGASAVQADPATGRLFLSRRDGAETRIERLEDRDAGLTYTWRSRPFRGRGPLTYGAARVEAAFSGAPPPEGERLDLRLYGDGVLRFERRITGSGPFRLPAGRRACAWEIELSGNVPVREIVLAESMEELG